MSAKENNSKMATELLSLGYKKVWFDEFEPRERVDVNQWSFQPYMRGFADLEISNSLDVARIVTDEQGNSFLRLTSHACGINEDGVRCYATTKSLTTGVNMTYTYGYLEIRAKVPTGRGVWPSFWLKSFDHMKHSEDIGKQLHYEFDSEVKAEVDVFEVFGNNRIISNIHKWWVPGSKLQKEYVEAGKSPQNEYITEYRVGFYELNDNDWHTYGFLWNETEISMYVDDELIYTYDLTKNFGAEQDSVDMSVFHKPLCIIFNNHLYTEGMPSYLVPVRNGVRENVMPDFVSADYDIDYIRLYQNENGKIYFAE